MTIWKKLKRNPWKTDNDLIIEKTAQKCLHKGCSECHGTGRKKDGTICIHHISCPCPRCTPRC